ncbi:3-ketoacyl-CoA thiolase B, peroxisomal-like isoform X2 [Dreissena polymorpha]|uniref:3-ketoacyl-CoA thiolase B, peroxisomal-like isoform X2 n=1 Tax=Dreissena polymorpha TaxID=45954 RepID=UPI0022652B5D|nr:3-ketoacyl-CoA thiolase B, peroxisomal-like isoform X2 [Dreissena polymorpha]
MERLGVIAQHLYSGIIKSDICKQEVSGSLPRFTFSPEDVVVVAALRTPIGKSRKGVFKDTHGDDLLSAAFTGVLKSVNFPANELGDICIGNVNDSKASVTARFAQFYSGIPYTVPVSSVNRQCGSGLQAFMNIAGGIKNKAYPVGMAGGVEMMSRDEMGKGFGDLNPKVMDFEDAKNSLIPMGAAAATKNGLFKEEIIAVTAQVEGSNGDKTTITVTEDEGIRGNTTMEVLSKLKPAFKQGGSTTAGNSSQTSDGAAAVLVASRAEAHKRGLPILGTLRAFAVTGVPPDEMGVGPAAAIPVALKMAGLTIADVDIFEINEAFASQAVYCVQKLGIPADKVNPKGGAIAFGHPLGATGARMIATLLHELKRRGKRSFGVVSMCMGTGMGAAAVFEHNP